jgi:RHS repeat-associated protein
MVSRTWQIAVTAALMFITAGLIYVYLPWSSDKLPSTAQVLNNAQMKSILGGHDGLIQEQKTTPSCPPCEVGKNMHVSAIRGTVYTDVDICGVSAAEGVTIGFRLHYDSGKADGTIARRQTVLGYGWTHKYNTYLAVRLRDVFMPDATGSMTRFQKRLDGSYTPSAGITDTLTSVDSATFILRKVNGTKITFKLADPAPWPTSATLYMMTQIEDAQGKLTVLSYNVNGLLEAVTDPYGRQVCLTYNGHGLINSIMNADGAVTEIEYQGADNDLWQITDPLGYTIEYTYDSQNRMVTEKLKDGSTWTCLYNASGKPYQLLDGDGQVYSTFTNSLNWALDMNRLLTLDEARYQPCMTTVTDGEGKVTSYDYDENSSVYRTHYADGSEGTSVFDNNLRPTSRTDEEGNQWRYEYDQYGNVTKTTDPLGNVTQMFYEHPSIHSLLTKKIEPDGDIWQYEYDSKGNLTKEIDPIIESPNDAVITHTYDSNGHRTSTTDRNGHITQWQYNADGALQKEAIDPCGLNVATEYNYDSAGRMTRETKYRGPGLTGPVVTDYEYDAMGRKIRESVDPGALNLTTRHELDGAGRTVATTNPRGVITRYQYDARGRLVKESLDPCGLNLITRYEYDLSDNTTKLIDRQGNETRNEYDSRNRQTKVIDAENYWTLYEYDLLGNQIRVSRSIAPGGGPFAVTEFRYDQLNRRTQEIIDPCGLNLITAYEYTVPGGGGCGCGCGTPGTSLIHKETDPAGKVTYYYYDHLDRMTSVVHKMGDTNDNGGDANDTVTAYEYDHMANKTKITLQNAPNTDVVTSYSYDAANRVVEETEGTGDANLTTRYAYDGLNRVIAATSPVGNVISNAFDNGGRLISWSDSIGVIATFTYDKNGNKLTQTDGLGRTWIFTYDNAGRCITVKDPLVETPNDKYTVNEYDNNGNIIQTTDNEGFVIINSYDRLGRQTATTYDPCDLAVTVSYEYDGLGNVTRILDDNGSTTSYEYDAASQKIREIYADGTETRFYYDASGNMASRVDQMGNTTSYAYDDMSRLVAGNYANAQTDTFVYDRAGQLLSADNNHSHVGLVYDTAGRISSEIQANIPETYRYTVGYHYNPADKTVAIDYPSGKHVVGVYDNRLRLAEVWQDGVKTTWYAYNNPSNQILTKSFNNGTHTEYAYNVNNWTTELRHIGSGGSIFAGFANDYDAVGNRLNNRNTQNVLVPDDTKPVTQSEKYTYDKMSRLVDFKRGHWSGGDILSPRRHRTWQIDGAQNWTGFSIDNKQYVNSVNQMNEYDDFSTNGPPPVPDDDGLPDDFMADTNILKTDLNGDAKISFPDLAIFAAHWLEADCIAPDFCGGSDLNQNGIADFVDFGKVAANWNKEAGYNWRHDKNGNLVDDGLREYYYDYQSSPASSVRACNLLTMVKDKATGNVLGQYWYDALGRRIRKTAGAVSTIFVMTPEWRNIEEYEGGVLARTYTYGDQLDEVLTMDRIYDAQRFYFHANALGSTVAVTDFVGAPAERYAYDAYGHTSFFDGNGNSISQSSVGNSYLFTSGRYDSESGLYYYRARYFNPVAGRFLTHDPIGEWADQSAMGNAFAYAGDNPITHTDTAGLGQEKYNSNIIIKVTKSDRFTNRDPWMKGSTECKCFKTLVTEKCNCIKWCKTNYIGHVSEYLHIDYDMYFIDIRIKKWKRFVEIVKEAEEMVDPIEKIAHGVQLGSDILKHGIAKGSKHWAGGLLGDVLPMAPIKLFVIVSEYQELKEVSPVGSYWDDILIGGHFEKWVKCRPDCTKSFECPPDAEENYGGYPETSILPAWCSEPKPNLPPENVTVTPFNGPPGVND